MIAAAAAAPVQVAAEPAEGLSLGLSGGLAATQVLGPSPRPGGLAGGGVGVRWAAEQWRVQAGARATGWFTPQGSWGPAADLGLAWTPTFAWSRELRLALLAAGHVGDLRGLAHTWTAGLGLAVDSRGQDDDCERFGGDGRLEPLTLSSGQGLALGATLSTVLGASLGAHWTPSCEGGPRLRVAYEGRSVLGPGLAAQSAWTLSSSCLGTATLQAMGVPGDFGQLGLLGGLQCAL